MYSSLQEDVLEEGMWSEQATFNPWSKQAAPNTWSEQATSRPRVRGGRSQTVGDENVDTEQLRLCQRLQSQLGFNFEEDEEESDGDFDLESSFRDEAVTLQRYPLQSADIGSVSGQLHPWNGSGYPVVVVEDDDDDGWISDKELTAPVLQPTGGWVGGCVGGWVGGCG